MNAELTIEYPADLDIRGGNGHRWPTHKCFRIAIVPAPYADGPKPVEQHIIDLSDDEWRPGCL